MLPLMKPHLNMAEGFVCPCDPGHTADSWQSTERYPTPAAVSPGEAPGTQHRRAATECLHLHDPGQGT